MFNLKKKNDLSAFSPCGSWEINYTYILKHYYSLDKEAFPQLTLQAAFWIWNRRKQAFTAEPETAPAAYKICVENQNITESNEVFSKNRIWKYILILFVNIYKKLTKWAVYNMSSLLKIGFH